MIRNNNMIFISQFVNNKILLKKYFFLKYINYNDRNNTKYSILINLNAAIINDVKL